MYAPSIALVMLFVCGTAVAQDEPGTEEEEAEGAAATTPEPDPEPEAPRRKVRHAARTELELAQSVGAMKGHQFLAGTGPVTLTEVSFTERIRNGKVRLRFPVDLSHLQTWGFALAELRGRAGAQVKVRGRGVEGELEALVTGAFRPAWADPYKVDLNGVVEQSNRQSYLAPSIGVNFDYKPARKQKISLSYAYKHYDYVDDPEFDPVAEPTHLTPGDQSRNVVGLAYVGRFDPVRVEVGIDMHHSAYTQRYARDAGTGLTHAGSTTTPANPLQQIFASETYANLRHHFGNGPAELRVGYGLEVDVDLYKGYYSYVGHHPSLGLDLEWEGGPTVELRSELYWRRAGRNGYAAGASHPPLDFGDRREDRRVKASLDVDVPVAKHVSVIAGGAFVQRTTNFPDYVPGVYPSTSLFSIDWDYTNWLATGGVRYRL